MSPLISMANASFRALPNFSVLLELTPRLRRCHGITAYSAARRTNEIGVRMALGANRSSVVYLVMSRSLLRVAIISGPSLSKPYLVSGVLFTRKK